jgi:transcriptional regulator with XRE-family HTH domain
MDMQIDSSKVRAERELRAWSQDHLAEVSGLSLRTIQRVESTGSASFETARALAAIFEVDIGTLRLPGEIRSWTFSRLRYVGIAASLFVALGLFITRDATAGEVMLDVVLELNNEKLGQHQLVANEGKSAEIRLEGQVRLLVNPIVTSDGSILLSMTVQEASGSRWVEVGDPRIMVANGNQGEVKVTSDKGNVYRIQIRPRRM